MTVLETANLHIRIEGGLFELAAYDAPERRMIPILRGELPDARKEVELPDPAEYGRIEFEIAKDPATSDEGGPAAGVEEGWEGGQERGRAEHEGGAEESAGEGVRDGEGEEAGSAGRIQVEEEEILDLLGRRLEETYEQVMEESIPPWFKVVLSQINDRAPRLEQGPVPGTDTFELLTAIRDTLVHQSVWGPKAVLRLDRIVELLEAIQPQRMEGLR